MSELIIISEKVMPYRSAFYRQLQELPDVNVDVWYLSDWGYSENFDPTMQCTYSWGKDSISGYSSRFYSGRSISNVKYTGVDKTGREDALGRIGFLLFYLRIFFSKVSLNAIRDVYNSNSHFVMIENYASLGSLLLTISAKISGKSLLFRGEIAEKERRRVSIFSVLKNQYVKFFLSMFDRYYYASESNFRVLLSASVDPSKCFYVPSAVDDSFFSVNRYTGEEISNIVENQRLRMGFNSETILFLGVGRLVRRKRWRDLLLAAVELKSLSVDFGIVIVGDGPDMEALKVFAKEHELPVYFSGFVAQESLPEFYISCDVVLQCSDYDPSPKALNEGLAFGKPCIVSDRVGTAQEVCVSGHNGFIYSCGSIESLSEAMINLVSSKEVFSAVARAQCCSSNLRAGAQAVADSIKGVT
jgi:glycosyltransferase involved in cell wall biosynthesis